MRKHPHRFNAEKALQAILYVAERLERDENLYAVLKVIYFADKDHLHRYGRFIFGDQYVAMTHGPVPSGAYGLVQYVRGDGPDLNFERAKAAFVVEEGKKIRLNEPANTEVLSDSDIACLDESIGKYGQMSFTKLKEASHDEAYRSADLNDSIAVEAIAAATGDEDLVAHLKNPYPG